MVGIVFIPRDMVSVDLLFIEDINGFEVAVVLCWISRISWSSQCPMMEENAKRETLPKQKTETADRERENTIASSRKFIHSSGPPLMLSCTQNHKFQIPRAMRMREFGWSLLSYLIQWSIQHIALEMDE